MLDMFEKNTKNNKDIENEQKLRQLEKDVNDLEQKILAFFGKIGLSPEELKEMQVEQNFSPEEQERVQKDRQLVEEEVERELQNIDTPDRKKQAFEELSQIQSNWQRM